MRELTCLQKNLPAVCELKYNEPMKNHTSFRIGGEAEIMAFPKSREELAAILKESGLLDTKPVILGAGTNVLAPDEGIPGVVICLKDCLDGMEQLDDSHIRVMGGVTMTRAAVYAANLGLSGLEFAHGIPGTVGGGVYMNAGAYGGEICQVCKSVEVMDIEGNISTLGCGCMHGVNQILICNVPRFFQKTGKISLISGVLNSCTYVGSALSTYGLALVTDAFGWSATVSVWCIAAALGTLCCAVCIRRWAGRKA